jgi:hypothetical protein
VCVIQPYVLNKTGSVLNGLSCNRVLKDIADALFLLFTLDYLLTGV